MRPDGLGYEPLATLNGTLEPRQPSSIELGGGISMTPQFGTTLLPSTLAPGVERWISSLAGSPASHTQPLGSGLERMTRETSGPTLCEYSLSQEHGDSLERTSLELFATDTFSPSWLTLKEKASRLRLSESLLAPLVDHTHERACSLWPTILASDGVAWKKSRQGSVQESISKVLCREEGPGQLRFIYLAQWISLGILPLSEFAEWMMGWPKGWTALSSAETEWTRMRRCRLSKSSSQEAAK